MADTIRVNGNVHSWGSIIFKIKDEKYHGADSITYGDKRERVEFTGMGKSQAPQGRSRGKYTTDVSKVSWRKGSAQSLRDALAAISPNGQNYGDVEFECVIEFVEEGDVPMVVELRRCVVVEDAANHSEGGDPLKDEISFKPMFIVRNGVTLFDSSEGLP